MFDQDIIVQDINNIIRKHHSACDVRIYDNGIEIVGSQYIKSAAVRMKVVDIIHNSGMSARSAKNLAAEWRVHNVAYDLCISRKHSKDALLDFVQDSRPYVRIATKIFEKLGLY